MLKKFCKLKKKETERTTEGTSVIIPAYKSFNKSTKTTAFPMPNIYHLHITSMPFNFLSTNKQFPIKTVSSRRAR